MSDERHCFFSKFINRFPKCSYSKNSILFNFEILQNDISLCECQMLISWMVYPVFVVTRENLFFSFLSIGSISYTQIQIECILFVSVSAVIIWLETRKIETKTKDIFREKH